MDWNVLSDTGFDEHMAEMPAVPLDVSQNSKPQTCIKLACKCVQVVVLMCMSRCDWALDVAVACNTVATLSIGLRSLTSA